MQQSLRRRGRLRRDGPALTPYPMLRLAGTVFCSRRSCVGQVEFALVQRNRQMDRFVFLLPFQESREALRRSNGSRLSSAPWPSLISIVLRSVSTLFGSVGRSKKGIPQVVVTC